MYVCICRDPFFKDENGSITTSKLYLRWRSNYQGFEPWAKMATELTSVGHSLLFFRADASRMSWEKLKITLVHNSEWSTSNWHLIESWSLHVSGFDVPKERPIEILNIINWRSLCMPVVIPPNAKQLSGNCLSMFQIRLYRMSWIGNVYWSHPVIPSHSCRKQCVFHICIA